ncbi:MAG: hypothetical protein NTW85_07740 [Methylococcales bacterium]|nr:hypothetical protein [Methylococcales bacterium]
MRVSENRRFQQNILHNTTLCQKYPPCATAWVGFRDNLLYVTLTLFGGIVAYAVSGTNFLALLILPWVCLIMGWTYLVNDEKILALGQYVRDKLSNGLAKALGIDENTAEMAWIFGWETAHRSDKCRVVG